MRVTQGIGMGMGASSFSSTRITQNMSMNSYTSRLGRVFANMDLATQKVATQRKFLSAIEDPASTARAYQLRSNFQKTQDWLGNVNDILDSMDTVDASIRVMVEMASHTHAKILEARNDTWSIDERMVFANELRAMQRTAVQSLNAKFDDKFLFGGSSTKSLPFELFDNPDGTQTLTFRGIDVTTTDPDQQARLREFASEQIFVDIGFGLKVDMNENGLPVVTDTSAFNIAMPGLNFLGFGPDPTDNFILNMGVIANTFEEEPFSHERTAELAFKMQDQHRNLLLAVTQKGADTNFLEIRRGVLEKNSDDLNAKILAVEHVDMAEAIMDMKMAEYVYRAMLEMGARILQPSFIDFMR